MPGESDQSQELKRMEAGESLLRILRPNYGALLCSIVAIVLGLYMTGSFFWPDGAARKLDFDTVIGWLLVPGGIYLMVGYYKEWMRVTDHGFEWHELFRHRELTWSTVRKLEWEPVHGTVCLRFFSDAGKLSMFLSQFRETDRPWLVRMIREHLPHELQEGWEKTESMPAWQRANAIESSDAWLIIGSTVGCFLALLYWANMPGEGPRPFGFFGETLSILPCPLIMVVCLVNLFQKRVTLGVVMALLLSGLGCVFTFMAILHLIRPA